MHKNLDLDSSYACEHIDGSFTPGYQIKQQLGKRDVKSPHAVLVSAPEEAVQTNGQEQGHSSQLTAALGTGRRDKKEAEQVGTVGQIALRGSSPRCPCSIIATKDLERWNNG